MSRVLLLKAWRRYRKVAVLSVLIISAYVGAVGRGESLLWVMAALLLSTLITAVSWPHWLVRQLAVTRRGPERANEGDTIAFRIDINNRGRLPRFMVEVVDRLPFINATDGAETAGEKVLGIVAFVRGRASRSFEVSVVCEKRGFYQLGPVSLASSFPLGVLEASQNKETAAQTLLVYPRVYPIVSMPLRGTSSQIHRGAFLLPEAFGAAEFCGLRDYRRGDNPRHIHWPTSARAGELMVKEFEPLASACLCLALDLTADANIGKRPHATLEYAIKIAASIARYATNKGMPIRLTARGRRSLAITGASGEHHYRNILEKLAVADSDGSTPYAQLLEEVAMDCIWGETVLLFLSEPDSRVEKTLQSMALLRSRGAQILAVWFDRSSFVGEASVGSFGNQGWQAALLDLGACYLRVRKGDDLLQLLNP